MALLSVAEALARVTQGLEPLEPERVPLEQARGRVLAEDVAADLTQPPFDASAMDGYAVRAADVATLPATLRLIGEALAGRGFDGEVGQGEAVRIFTGAPVPKGADTVVIQENTEAAPGVVTVKEAAPRRHIRPRGQDFSKGEVLLRAGSRLGPRELMLAAAMNHAELPVRRKPKVAILATGDEVVPPGTALDRDQIVSSVPAGLAALIEAQGGEPMSLGIAQDTPKASSHWPAPAALRTSSSPSAEPRSASGTWSAPRFAPKAWSSTSGRSPCGRGSPSSMAGLAISGCSACRATPSRR